MSNNLSPLTIKKAIALGYKPVRSGFKYYLPVALPDDYAPYFSDNYEALDSALNEAFDGADDDGNFVIVVEVHALMHKSFIFEGKYDRDGDGIAGNWKAYGAFEINLS
jgi:hypothetical protein